MADNDLTIIAVTDPEVPWTAQVGSTPWEFTEAVTLFAAQSPASTLSAAEPFIPVFWDVDDPTVALNAPPIITLAFGATEPTI